MARALHDPAHGYYARRIAGVGRRGDFTTSPMLSEAPAHAIAAWVRLAMSETGGRHLIEIGPGEGTLADDVLRHLPWLTRRRIRLHLVETSAPLTAIQQARLGQRPHWHREVTDALRAADGRALIYSNELVDAFPVRRFRLTETGWMELHLYPTAPPREIWLPAGTLPDSTIFSQSFQPGQTVEVHDSYRAWLRAWLPFWKAGRMLTIDYGAPADTLYYRRPHGSLRAYLFQQRLEGAAVYENPGRQDLTADVNVNDLQHWTSPWLATRSLTSQSDWLQPFVRLDHPEDAYLINQAGAGHAFFVLEQAPHTLPA